MPSTQSKPARRTIEVNLLGQRMTLKVGDDPRHVERLAAYVERKLEETRRVGSVSSTKLALLAALNIADDYFRTLDGTRAFRREVAARARALVAELDG